METDREPTFWEMLSPLWMFHCRPADFRCSGECLCPGICWLPGMVTLVSLHAVNIHAVWFLWGIVGGWALISLLPLVMVWVWCVAADVKFRWQRPTREERSGFDMAVVNWFGLASTLTLFPVTLPMTLAAVLWWLALA